MSSAVAELAVSHGKPGDRTGWQAAVDVTLEHGPSRTRIARCAQRGPLYVQRAFYPEGDGTAHLYLLHPPGGLVQGDRLSTHVRLGEAAKALVTTPAAAKLYRTPAGATRQNVRLSVAERASLEWLPLETIVFSGAHAQTRLRADVSAQACLVAWEVVCLGRPASGETFDDGLFDSVIELAVDGVLHWIERTRIPGHADSRLGRACWGLGGRCVMGTLIAVGPGGVAASTLQSLREQVDEPGSAGVTDIDGTVVCRALGASVRAVRERLSAAWELLRPALLGKSSVTPRVWST